jgi:serine-type D-Ala-D-Ala carboxypeptidase (penicillin-binding protein 5/6)
MLKKLTAFALFLLLAALPCPVSAQTVAVAETAEEAKEVPFELQAEAALLLDVGSGTLLAAKNIHEQIYPASVTKIMTMLLALEAVEAGRVSLDDQVVISESAASLGGSQIFLSPGDVVSLGNLLIGVGVGSGNDASVAVAEHCSGSLETFVEKMNDRAQALGMERTRFMNPHGLHEEGHYTTAFDVSIMSRELLKYPQIHEWLTIWMDENFLEGQIRSGRVFLSNSNKMVRYYQGADGLKTGYTREAQHCIAATARRGDTRYLAVIMKAPDSDTRFNEARKLLDYGFANYESVPVVVKGEEMAIIRVDKGKEALVGLAVADSLSLLKEKGAKPEIRKEIEVREKVSAPLAAGEPLGTLKVYQDGELAGTVDLVTAAEVPRAGFRGLLVRALAAWLKFGR